MAIEHPLGSPSYRGNTDAVLPRLVEGTLVAGVAVSAVKGSEQPTVKLFDGTAFGGFATHDVCNVRKVSGVIKFGEGICLRIKEGAVLGEGNAFGVDNTTGEVVVFGTADSTGIIGSVHELGITGLDENGNTVENCGLFNVYGGVAPTSAGTGGVTSINGNTGDVTLTASDVGALPDTYTAPVNSVNGQTGDVELTSGDVNALPDTYTAPVASVNGNTGEVVLAADDVGALADTYTAPVTSVNGETGAVVLDAADVGAEPAAPAAEQQSASSRTKK
ncbi:hypothetical protein THF1D04_10745 [Vibrio owensii]|uniref:Uncharacterized protein n=1 Tax=Vibrio owensii TaxID=696485 RepID=A0AAU9PYY6_9VIBR|nr:hypothetical protein THF1D04_10745 [Vibrio owensii]